MSEQLKLGGYIRERDIEITGNTPKCEVHVSVVGGNVVCRAWSGRDGTCPSLEVADLHILGRRRAVDDGTAAVGDASIYARSCCA